MYRKLRITVLRRELYEDLAAEYVADPALELPKRCELYEEGQEFLIEGWPRKPEGFCEWAWDDIQKAVVAASFGGKRKGVNPPDAWIVCCTDGLRPVVFRVEPLPEDDETQGES